MRYADAPFLTESRPVCRRCTQSRLGCNYGLHLIWEEDALSLGKCHGRVGAWSKNAGVKPRHKNCTRAARCGSDAGLWRSQHLGEAQGSLRRQRSHQAFLNTTTEHLRLYYKLEETKCLPREDNHLCQSPPCTVASNLQCKYRNLPSLLSLGGIHSNLSLFPPSSASSEVESIPFNYYKNVVCFDSIHIRCDDEHDARQYILS